VIGNEEMVMVMLKEEKKRSQGLLINEVNA